MLAMATWHPVTLSLTDRWGPLPPHADIRPPRRGLRRLERLLLFIGVTLLSFSAYVIIESALYQRFENRELDAILQSANAHRQSALQPQDAGNTAARVHSSE